MDTLGGQIDRQTNSNLLTQCEAARSQRVLDISHPSDRNIHTYTIVFNNSNEIIAREF